MRVFFYLLAFILVGCESPLKPPPVIDPRAEQETGQQTMEETVEVGPRVANDGVTLKNRRFVLAEEQKAKPGAVSGGSATQQAFPITIDFNSVGIREAMQAFALLTDSNILVGDEVAGVITAKLHNEPWDQAIRALLDMKSLAMHVNSNTGLISIRGRSELQQTENFQKAREEALQSAQRREAAFRPVKSEIIRLYYADPTKVKAQIEEIYKTQGEGQVAQAVQVSIVSRLRALVVKGSTEEIDFVNKYIEQVDVSTEQVLIEAFIVEATNKFEEELGSRLGFTLGGVDATAMNDTTISGLGGGPASANTFTGQQFGDTVPASILGTAPGSISNTAAGSALGGIGFLQKGNLADLKIELTAMEKDNLGRIVSNPKVFTLDNEPAIIQQGTQIPYQTTSAQGTQTQFVDATLKLEVTPSIVGDGNIVLKLKINKDSPQPTGAAQPPINKMEINTQLLMTNGQIAVIGGVFTEDLSSSVEKMPILGDLPGIGFLFRKEFDKDDRKQIFIFVAPRII